MQQTKRTGSYLQLSSWREVSAWPSMGSWGPCDCQVVSGLTLSGVRGRDLWGKHVACGKGCLQERCEGLQEATWHLSAVLVWSVNEYSGDPLFRDCGYSPILGEEVEPSDKLFCTFCPCILLYVQISDWFKRGLLVLRAGLCGLRGLCRA